MSDDRYQRKFGPVDWPPTVLEAVYSKKADAMSDDPFEFKSPPPKRVTISTYRADAMSDDRKPGYIERLVIDAMDTARLEAIEECAKLIESGAGMADLIDQDELDQQAEYIRALKSKPPRADAMSDDYSDGYTHEALHTVLVLRETFKEHVSDSRCADEFPEIKAAAELVSGAMFDLYWMIGEKLHDSLAADEISARAAQKLKAEG